jgi:hypothetical protein
LPLPNAVWFSDICGATDEKLWHSCFADCDSTKLCAIISGLGVLSTKKGLFEALWGQRVFVMTRGRINTWMQSVSVGSRGIGSHIDQVVAKDKTRQDNPQWEHPFFFHMVVHVLLFGSAVLEKFRAIHLLSLGMQFWKGSL